MSLRHGVFGSVKAVEYKLTEERESRDARGVEILLTFFVDQENMVSACIGGRQG